MERTTLKKDAFRLKILDSAEENKELFSQNLELLFVLQGTLDVTVEGKVSHLGTEDILAVNANKRHKINASSSVLYMQLDVEQQIIADTLRTAGVLFWCDSTTGNNDRYEQLRDVLKKLLNRYLELRGDTVNFGHYAICYEIMDLMAANFMLKTTDASSPDEHNKFDDRLRQINDYIHANYDSQISMKELSEKLYLSNGYLSRFFKKNYGMSFAEYLTSVRLYHSVDDLLYTDSPITRIAYNNGFTSVALFNKAFKKNYGKTPSEFRKETVRQSEPETTEKKQRDIENKLEKILVIDEPKEEEPEGKVKYIRQTVDITSAEPLKRYWGNMINTGVASDLLHSSMQEHLLLLKSSLDFKYVRFWNIFSEEFLIDPEADVENYNFSRVDAVIDAVLEQGLKPYIELGAKPKLIHYHIGYSKALQGSQMDRFSLPVWCNLMTQFMRHLVHRYGREELDDWIMELWFDERWRLQKNGMIRYLRLFEETYKIVKSFDENIRIGGYGVKMDAGAEKRIELYREWNRRESRPDFLSLGFYPYERGEDLQDNYAKRNTSDDCMKQWVEREKKYLDECGLNDVPIIINEWNQTVSSRNFMNDSAFKGAYIVKNVIDLYDMVEDMGYFCGSDRSSNYVDTSEPLFGGTGLLTKDGILKPAGFALNFLNRLLPFYVNRGRNYLISTDKHDNYGIVCHNQQVLNYNYYLTEETDLEKDHLWKYFEGRKKLELNLDLKNVKEGDYQVKIYRINDTNGNVLGTWKDLGYMKDLSKNDISYFRRICEPNLKIRMLNSRDGVLHIEEELQPNEIMFIKIYYQV